ncbi:MAG TPA: L-threonylcarbamoyladenylate synthase [Patescibacteria group bacterium]|jgi:L-threonylcarbamoyladenylate synthase|nr:L-threonylcarbamoyladenylate synthase [Patescibacteria group bacterium]
MIIIKYQKQNHKAIVHAVALALKQGKVVAYPTDTSYGLAVDVTNASAIKKFYKIKERTPKKPVHIVVASIAQAKKFAQWNRVAQKLATKFWPGALSLVLPVAESARNKQFIKWFSSGTKTIGLRVPNNQIALDIVKQLKNPITASGANPAAIVSGGFDSYSAEDIYKQFSKQKHKPDIIIDAGKLPKRKPSTLIKIEHFVQGDGYEILRKGPITKKQIDLALKSILKK